MAIGQFVKSGLIFLPELCLLKLHERAHIVEQVLEGLEEHLDMTEALDSHRNLSERSRSLAGPKWAGGYDVIAPYPSVYPVIYPMIQMMWVI